MDINIHIDKRKRCYNRSDEVHNSYGPDVIYSNGYKSYCINGKLHNIHGYAGIYLDGISYWLDGSNYTKEEWEYEVNKIK